MLFSRGEEKQGMANKILAERRTGNSFAKDFLANKQACGVGGPRERIGYVGLHT